MVRWLVFFATETERTEAGPAPGIFLCSGLIVLYIATATEVSNFHGVSCRVVSCGVFTETIQLLIVVQGGGAVPGGVEGGFILPVSHKSVPLAVHSSIFSSGRCPIFEWYFSRWIYGAWQCRRRVRRWLTYLRKKKVLKCNATIRFEIGHHPGYAVNTVRNRPYGTEGSI